jgi:hypothetical protein
MGIYLKMGRFLKKCPTFFFYLIELLHKILFDFHYSLGATAICAPKKRIAKRW